MKNIHCLGTGMGLSLPESEQIPLMAEAGFEAFFTGWKRGTHVRDCLRVGAACGLLYQSVHAPFGRVHKVWDEGEEGDAVIAELTDCLCDCAENGVPLMIVHPIKGMDKHTPTLLGLERFSRLVRAAEDTDVTLAFENVEGIEYLLAIRDALGSSDAVGYCWDTGHEMCYNGCADIPALFRGKLICTHINDNNKQTGADITWLDDSHLVPFDGKADWRGVAARLDRENYRGIMTYELTTKSKPERNTHAIYDTLSPLDFMKLAMERALRLDALRVLENN